MANKELENLMQSESFDFAYTNCGKCEKDIKPTDAEDMFAVCDACSEQKCKIYDEAVNFYCGMDKMQDVIGKYLFSRLVVKAFKEEKER